MKKLFVAAAASSLLAAAHADNAPADSRAAAIHDRALTVDAHLDIRDDFAASGALTGKDTADQFDLPKLERGKLDVAVVSLFADPAKISPASVQALFAPPPVSNNSFG